MNADPFPPATNIERTTRPDARPAPAASQAELEELYREQLRRMFCPTCGEAEPEY